MIVGCIKRWGISEIYFKIHVCLQRAYTYIWYAFEKSSSYDFHNSAYNDLLKSDGSNFRLPLVLSLRRSINDEDNKKIIYPSCQPYWTSDSSEFRLRPYADGACEVFLSMWSRGVATTKKVDDFQNGIRGVQFASRMTTIFNNDQLHNFKIKIINAYCIMFISHIFNQIFQSSKQKNRLVLECNDV